LTLLQSQVSTTLQIAIRQIDLASPKAAKRFVELTKVLFQEVEDLSDGGFIAIRRPDASPPNRKFSPNGKCAP
jgi:hypothetical protein